MELKLKQVTFPEVIEFNFSELKKEIEERTASYVGLVYSEDQIKDAKKDVAMLRKFTKALSDERIRVKKELMKPYEEFEGKIKELTGIVDKAISEIDVQIKEFEDKQKQDKLEEIKNLWTSCDIPEGLAFEKIFDQKWLNASTSMKAIQDSIDSVIGKFNEDMTSLSNLPEYAFEAQQVYISTLDIGRALNEAHRLSEVAKKKAEAERLKAEREAKLEPEKPAETLNNPPTPDAMALEEDYVAPKKQWISFAALLTVDQAKELKQFFDARNIDFKAI